MNLLLSYGCACAAYRTDEITYPLHIQYTVFCAIMSHHIGKRGPIFGSDECHVEAGLKFGLVPAGERSARVCRLELRDCNDSNRPIGTRVIGAVEASDLLAHCAAVFDR